MKKVFNVFLLDKEAYLFDAKLYILKAFASVLTAYAVVTHLPLVNKDMISVLFGLMMTLEPVTVTGIRSGFRQITATLMGALATTIVLLLFGINIWTVALSVSATLFLCLKINWREVSAVAIFTSIYMTQFVQYTANGEPSITLTFLLRILALGIGVLIAVFYNFIFSLFFYQQMEQKRIVHILTSLTGHMKQIRKGVEENSREQLYKEQQNLRGTFHGIDWLSSLILDKEKEAMLKKRLGWNSHLKEIAVFRMILQELRTMTHLIYDAMDTIATQMDYNSAKEKEKLVKKMDELILECEVLASGDHTGNNQSKEPVVLTGNRLFEDLEGIQRAMHIIDTNLKGFEHK